MKKVIMKVYAGGAWEGHVVYQAQHPENNEIELRTSYLQEVRAFCEQHQLLEDSDFMGLVRSKLVIQTSIGKNSVSNIFIIPLEYIDENRAISSAGEFLKKEFNAYY